MLDLVFLIGLILLVVGLVKRKTGWGKAAAFVGAAGVLIVLVVNGPEMAESFMQGYRDARSD